MFTDDLRRTFGAWRAQPLLPLSALAFGLTGLVAVLYGGAATVALAPTGIFYIGVVGAQRKTYARTWEGQRTSMGKFVELSLDCFGQFFVLGLLALVVGGVGAAGGWFVAGELGALIGGFLLVDVLFTFATSAVAVGSQPASEALATSWRMIRTGLPRCLPHVLFVPLVLRGLAQGNAWLLLVAEVVALVARGVTTSYYLKVDAQEGPPRIYGERREPALYG